MWISDFFSRVSIGYDWAAHPGDPLWINAHFAVGKLRVVEQIGHCVDGAGRDDRFLKGRKQKVALPNACFFREFLLERGAVCNPRRIGGEALVLGESRDA